MCERAFAHKHTHIYIYIYICVCSCVHVCVSVCVCACAYIYIYIYIYVCVCVCVSVCIFLFMCTRVCTCVHKRVRSLGLLLVFYISYVYTLELNDTIGRISRFSYNDADATNEELLSNLTYPTSVVLDVPNDRMYWSELGSSTIGIAKLDGTELGTMKAERKIKYMTMFGKVFIF